MIHELRKQKAILCDPLIYEARAKMVDGFDVHAYSDDDDTDWFGDPMPAMQITPGGVAIIPVKGIISSGLPSIFKKFGYADCAAISEDIISAYENPAVNRIILDCDSPGGMVTGTPELGDLVSGSPKPIDAFIGSQGCSACYWIVAGCVNISCTKSSDVGSIGVYQPMVDYSKAFEMFGISVTLAKSGKYKGAGYPGTSMTDEQSQAVLQDVLDIAQMFYAHVLAGRPGQGITSDTMQGQSFMGQKARNAGLVDGLVTGISDLLTP